MNRQRNLLMEALRQNSKNSYFDSNGSVVSYKTGFPVLDYYLGYKINVFDDNDKLQDSYASIGITGGSFVTFMGKPSTSKTTTAVQVAANIVRQFECGSVVHFDLEQALNYTRIQTLTKYPMSAMGEGGKYVLRQEQNSIDDIYAAIMELYFEKVKNPEKYKYDTGKLNEFGKPIVVFQPTVVIIDSIATLSMHINEDDKSDVKKISELEGNTYANRLARDISQFYNKLLPRLRTANIIVIAINQIKTKVDIGIVSTPAQLLYLDQNETAPGGWAPMFLAHIMLKFVAVGSEKFTDEENGFSGFGVRAKIIKARTNQAGESVHLIYDNVRGIDPIRSTIDFAKDLGLTGGNKKSMYFLSNKDDKFSLTNVHESFHENRNLYKIMYDNVIPVLEDRLSGVTEEELQFDDEMMSY